MLSPVNLERMEAEGELRIFFKLFSILAAHFQLKDGILNFTETLESLARKYDSVIRDDREGDKELVASLPSILPSPLIKEQILK
jgi:hypothetical protein